MTTNKLGWAQLKPHAKAGADYLCAKFNPSVAGGWRPGPAGRPHPSGLAVDFMTYRNKELGNAIAAYSVANRANLGNIWYVIWDRKIWSTTRPEEGWISYDGSNPHTDHVHVSWHESGTASGPIIDPIGDEDESGNPLTGFTDILNDLSNPQNYARLGLFAAGLVLVIIGLFRFAFVQKAAIAAGKVAKSAR